MADPAYGHGTAGVNPRAEDDPRYVQQEHGYVQHDQTYHGVPEGQAPVGQAPIGSARVVRGQHRQPSDAQYEQAQYEQAQYEQAQYEQAQYGDPHGYDPADAYGTAAPRRGSALVQGVGAVLSLTLLVGVGVWGYQQIQRDVSGVPVVRALEGPMRRAPENPGGMVADHAGLAVNSVQAAGSAAPTADTLTLAPATIALADEDQAGASLRPQARAELSAAPSVSPTTEAADADLAATGAATGTGAETAQATSLTEDVTEADPVALALAMAERAVAGETPLSSATTGDDAAAATQTPVPTTTQAPVTGPGVKRSLRPVPRPGARPSTNAAQGVLASASPTDISPDQVTPGSRLVQLGAFDSAEDAKSAWNRISGKMSDMLADKQRLITEAQAGGRTFWRLRAVGFDDLSDARRFCAAIAPVQPDCVPVVAR